MRKTIIALCVMLALPALADVDIIINGQLEGSGGGGGGGSGMDPVAASNSFLSLADGGVMRSEYTNKNDVFYGTVNAGTPDDTNWYLKVGEYFSGADQSAELVWKSYYTGANSHTMTQRFKGGEFYFSHPIRIGDATSLIGTDGIISQDVAQVNGVTFNTDSYETTQTEAFVSADYIPYEQTAQYGDYASIYTSVFTSALDSNWTANDTNRFEWYLSDFLGIYSCPSSTSNTLTMAFISGTDTNASYDILWGDAEFPDETIDVTCAWDKITFSITTWGSDCATNPLGYFSNGTNYNGPTRVQGAMNKLINGYDQWYWDSFGISVASQTGTIYTAPYVQKTGDTMTEPLEISVADCSQATNALVISSTYSNIAIGLNATADTLKSTAVGEGSNAGAYSFAGGSEAKASSSSVAVGWGANGGSLGSALGRQANGASSGVGIGYQANGFSSAVCIGYEANGSSHGTALGRQANGTDYGVAIGRVANGRSRGVGIGYNANGYAYTVAVGSDANSYLGGTAVGRQANAWNYGTVLGWYSSSGGQTNSIAIGVMVTNDIPYSARIRGDLYLDGATQIKSRPTFGDGVWNTWLPPAIASIGATNMTVTIPDTTSSFTNLYATNTTHWTTLKHTTNFIEVLSDGTVQVHSGGDGTYEIGWSASITDFNGEFEVVAQLNGTNNQWLSMHRKNANDADIGSASFIGTIDLVEGDEVRIVGGENGASDDITFVHMQTLFRRLCE